MHDISVEVGKNIYRVDNLVPDHVLEDVERELSGCGWKYGWQSNLNVQFGHWHHDFFSEAGAHSTDPIERQLPESILSVWNVIRARCIPDAVLLRVYANGHTYGTDGYPHKDGHTDDGRTVVLYLNRHWKMGWAGELVFFEREEIVAAVLPKYGRAVIFPSTCVHAARSVSRICPALRMCLVFKAQAKQSLDSEQDRLNR